MNVWEQYAEQAIPNPRKARLRAAEKRKRKALGERDLLYRMWQKWHKERTEELLKAYPQARQLSDYLAGMGLDDGDRLIELVKAGPWIGAGRDVRFLVLGLIDRGIINLRERHGMAGIDDPIDGESVYLIIKEMLDGRS